MSFRNRMPEWKKQRARDMRSRPTRGEAEMWELLRDRRLGGFKFRRQAPMLGYIADFYCPELKLIIEFDGDGHDSSRDAKRDSVFDRAGFKTLRVYPPVPRPAILRALVKYKTGV